MGLGLLFFLLVAEAVFVAAAAIVLLVMLFMTGRRAPDPRGMLLPAAFSLALTLAGLLGALASVGVLGSLAGAEAAGAGVQTCSATIIRGGTIGGSAGAVVPLAQIPPQPPPPPRPPTFPPFPTPTFSMPPMPRYTIDPQPPLDIPDVDPGEFDPGEFDPPQTRCESGTGRRVASTFPWLLVSGAALGGGSRMFRQMLNEERSR